MPIGPIYLSLDHFSSRPHRIGQLIQNLHGCIPTNASIGDTDALLEARWSLWWDLLISFIDVRLDHHSHDSSLALAELVSYRLSDLGLVTVVLLRVPYRS